jgi:hypothetical protein
MPPEKKMRDDIADFDIKVSREELAQEKWVKLCGGDGSTNFHDRNYQINHNVQASAEELEGGSSAEVSINITVSAAIISAAYHKSSSLAAVAEAELAVKEAKTKKAAEDAKAKLTAAKAAAANRATAESEEAIEAQLTKTITDNCMERLLKQYQAGRLNLNVPAVQSQSTQRDGTANRDHGRGRGRARTRTWHSRPSQRRRPTTKPRTRTRRKKRNSATFSRDVPTCVKFARPATKSVTVAATRPISIAAPSKHAKSILKYTACDNAKRKPRQGPGRKTRRKERHTKSAEPRRRKKRTQKRAQSGEEWTSTVPSTLTYHAIS